MFRGTAREKSGGERVVLPLATRDLLRRDRALSNADHPVRKFLSRAIRMFGFTLPQMVADEKSLLGAHPYGW